VGQRGVRIQAIVRELHDEKIDVIEWNPDPTAFIAKAISPARVNGVYLKESVDGSRNALVVVPEDQLSLAIGRDGQNARLAAKLTGWRIDIKSLPESISDWLFALQNKPELKEMAKEEKAAIAQAEDIMARKADGRVINPEEYDLLSKFNDRLESFATRKHQAEVEKQQKLRDEIMEDIPPAAFEMDLSGTGLQANILEALVEAGFDTAGKLVLTSKMNPDALLEVNGFGPKALERVAEFAEVLPELVPEPVEEEEPEVEQPVEEQPSTESETQAEAEEEVTPEAEQAETPEAQVEEAETAEAVKSEESTAEEGEEELSFDEMFTVNPEVFEPEQESEDEEESSEDDGTTGGKKKRKKKVKRFRELEYDPERDVVVAKKKHKRDGTPWNEWEE
jgi:N utilization substance protein A